MWLFFVVLHGYGTYCYYVRVHITMHFTVSSYLLNHFIHQSLQVKKNHIEDDSLKIRTIPSPRVSKKL